MSERAHTGLAPGCQQPTTRYLAHHIDGMLTLSHILHSASHWHVLHYCVITLTVHGQCALPGFCPRVTGAHKCRHSQPCRQPDPLCHASVAVSSQQKLPTECKPAPPSAAGQLVTSGGPLAFHYANLCHILHFVNHWPEFSYFIKASSS
jgi:hypothetical protein